MRKFKPFIVIAICLLFVVVAYSFTFYGYVSTSYGNKIMVNGKIYATKTKLRPGKYTIRVINPLKKNTSKEVLVYPFGRYHIDNTGSLYNVKDVMELAGLTLPNSYYVSDSKFLADNSWLVIKMFNSDKTSKVGGFTAILRYSYTEGWKIYNTGTGLVDDELRHANYQVYNYLIGDE